MNPAIIERLRLRVGTSVAAAGSVQGDATALSSSGRGRVIPVTAADGTKGVILPTPIAGNVVMVYNNVSANGLKIYPHTGGDINDGTTNAAVTIEGFTLSLFVAIDTTTWAAMYTVNT